MKYIALLRGINVSGKNKIPMKELKDGFIECGYSNVKTLLNSGNVVFDSEEEKNKIHLQIVSMIQSKFDLDIPIYLIAEFELEDVLNHAPDWWDAGDKAIYDNLIFIMEPCTFEEVERVIGDPKEGIEQILNYKNAIFWSFDVKKYPKTSYIKTASTSINDFVTIRTANTMKKCLKLCKG